MLYICLHASFSFGTDLPSSLQLPPCFTIYLSYHQSHLSHCSSRPFNFLGSAVSPCWILTSEDLQVGCADEREYVKLCLFFWGWSNFLNRIFLGPFIHLNILFHFSLKINSISMCISTTFFLTIHPLKHTLYPFPAIMSRAGLNTVAQVVCRVGY